MTKVKLLRSPARPERKVYMTFGSDFFKIFNFAIQLLRLFAKIFGDDEDKKRVAESEARSEADSGDAC